MIIVQVNIWSYLCIHVVTVRIHMCAIAQTEKILVEMVHQSVPCQSSVFPAKQQQHQQPTIMYSECVQIWIKTYNDGTWLGMTVYEKFIREHKYLFHHNNGEFRETQITLWAFEFNCTHSHTDSSNSFKKNNRIYIHFVQIFTQSTLKFFSRDTKRWLKGISSDNKYIPE